LHAAGGVGVGVLVAVGVGIFVAVGVRVFATVGEGDFVAVGPADVIVATGGVARVTTGVKGIAVGGIAVVGLGVGVAVGDFTQQTTPGAQVRPSASGCQPPTQLPVWHCLVGVDGLHVVGIGQFTKTPT